MMRRLGEEAECLSIGANHWDPRQTNLLTEGLVMTIEPMVTTGSGQPIEDDDGSTIRTRDGRVAAHHEDTLVITRDRPIVLTSSAPA